MGKTFEELVACAMPYAEQALDAQAAGAEAAAFSKAGHESAVYLHFDKTTKANGQAGFPCAACVTRREPAERGDGYSLATLSFGLVRPDYSPNPDGFKGNHLVCAVIELLRRSIAEHSAGHVLVFTSQAEWARHCSTPLYRAEREGNVLSDCAGPAEDQIPARPKARL